MPRIFKSPGSFVGERSFTDDTKLYFGANSDGYLEYDEDGGDRLILSGAKGGLNLSGSAIYVGTSRKIYFGDPESAYIFYGDPGGGSNQFAINLGSAGGAIYMPDNNETAFLLGEAGNNYISVSTKNSEEGITFSKTPVVATNVSLSIGTPGAGGYPSTIKYDGAEMIISGAAGGIQIQAPPSVTDAFALADETDAHTFTFDTRGGSNTPFLFQAEAGSAYVAQFFNDGDDPARYGIKIQGGGDAGGGTTYYVNCFDGDGGNVGYMANISETFAVTDPSDARLKDNIRDTAIVGLETVDNIKVRDFEMKKTGTSKTGFVAQELQEAYTPAVTVAPGPEEMMGVAYSVLVPVLTKAVQELHTKVKELENRLEE